MSMEQVLDYGDVRIPYEIVPSRRKSYALHFTAEKGLEVRVPLRFSELIVRKLLTQHEDWIRKKYAAYQALEERKKNSPYSEEDVLHLQKIYRKAAKEYFPKRVEYYVNELFWEDSEIYAESGKPYVNITIRDQKTRWGSCSSKGTLSFSWRLMLAPPRVLDYVVLHEICHLKEMNHSAAFWNLVGSVMPDYKEYRKWLRDHGSELYF